MDAAHRLAHLQDLIGQHRALTERLEAHREKLLTHHKSRERDRALVHAGKSLRRAGKLQRSLDRALRNEGRRHSHET